MSGPVGGRGLTPNTSTLLLINGAPGSGKSTPAARIAAERRLGFALDIDRIKHALGGWEQDLQASGCRPGASPSR